MVNWEYNNNVSKPSFSIIPVGNYRCRNENAEECVSKTGKDMIKMEIKVSGQSGRVFYNIVFMPEGTDKNGNPLRDITDRNLANVFDSFGIPDGDLNITNWIGKVGGVRIKHEMYNGEPQARVHYFLNKAQQVSLPTWLEDNGQSVTPQTGDSNINWDE